MKPEFTYENQGTYSFLVYRLKPGQAVDNFAMNMLASNQIDYVLPIAFSQTDGTTFLRYNITSRVTMKSFFMGTLQKKRLFATLQSIATALSSVTEYMMDNSWFILDEELIFVDVSTGKAAMVYYPVPQAKRQPVDFQAFFKNIMVNSHFDQTEDCRYVATLLNYLNGTSVFSLKEFLNLLVKEENEANQGAPAVFKSPVPQGSAAQGGTQLPPTPQPQQQMPAAASPTVAQAPPPFAPPPAAPVMPKQGPPKKKSGLFGFSFGKKDKAASKAEKVKKPAKIKKSKKQMEQAPATGAQNLGFAIPGQEIPFANGNGATGPGYTGQPTPEPMGQPIPSSPLQQSMAAQPPAPPMVPSPAPVPVPAPPLPVQNGATPVHGNFGETTVLNIETSADTTVLGPDLPVVEQKERVPALQHELNGEIVLITKPLLRVGKERQYVDHCISGNSAISRSHADILVENGVYYIRDNNSLNHTYVNGAMIESNTQTPLQEGDIIMFANEQYRFVFK